MNIRMIFRRMLVLAIFFAVIATACNEKDDPAPDVNNPNDAINAWIFDIMDEVYYWTDQLPAESATNDRLDPVDYFNSLMVDEDRFSRIYPDYQDLLNQLEGRTTEAGYDFQPVQTGERIVFQIKYVKDENASPAFLAGLERGDRITAINGTTITAENYITLIGETTNAHTITYERLNTETLAYEEMGDVALDVKIIEENPNFLDTVYTFGNHKIGYFMYTFFRPGISTQNPTEYDDEMDAVFASFKSEGVTDLIIDLRYNLGGAISSATNLASLIAPNVTSSDILYENQWNDLYQNYIEGLENGDDILRGKFVEKAGNIGADLNAATVYVLVSRETASASELVINGLIPYMNVELIGFTTIGKNVGSIPIEDEDDPENTYGLLPIVLKTFNSAGNSDYDQGFTPTGDKFINEYQYPWYPEGDVRDPLIKKAVELITGEVLPSRIAGRISDQGVGYPLPYKKPGSDLADLPIIMDNIELPKN